MKLKTIYNETHFDTIYKIFYLNLMNLLYILLYVFKINFELHFGF